MITLDTPIKFLGEDGRGTHSGKRSYPVNRWMRVKGDLVLCQNGYHYTTPRYWRTWLTPRIHLIEVEESIFSENKFCARGIKLAPRLETWTPRSAARFAADCAERVLPIFERVFPGDLRPRRAVEAARSGPAAEAAWAAWAAWAAEAAEAAEAARAVRAAAEAAAWAAAGAAGAAAWAAEAAARAAEAAEIQWQDAQFLRYLNGEV